MSLIAKAVAPKISKSALFNASQVGKATTPAKLELQELQKSGLVSKGIERFERTSKPVFPAKPASSAQSVTTQVQPLEASARKLPDASPKTNAAPAGTAGGWRQWFQLPHIPLIY